MGATMAVAQNTTGAVLGVGAGPFIVWLWGYYNPDYPMDAVAASFVAGVVGTFFGSLLPELWGMAKNRFNPPPSP